MADRSIKGITIEIGGDTTGLTDALKSVDKATKRTTFEIKEIDKALKLDPSNIELVAQKQELLTEQINNTSERLNVLRTAQQQVEEQFRNGDIGAEQYRAFQRELISTESQLSSFENQLESMSAEQDRLAQSTRDLGTFFEATGTDISQFTEVLGSRLSDAIRNGTANADQMGQALGRISRSVLGTSTDLTTLQQTLRQVDSTNIEQVALELNQLGESANDADHEVGGLKDSLGGIAGAAAGAIGGISILEAAFEDASNKAKIEMRLDVDEASIESAEASVREVTAIVGDNGEALEAVSKQWQLYGENSKEANEEILRNASAISYAYEDIDLKELIQESSEISKVFKISQNEALALSNGLLKIGFPPDQLDIISEYGTQIMEMGYSAEEAFGLMAAAANSDTWNIDNLLDGIKEARLTMSEFAGGWDVATAHIIDQAGLTGDVFQGWGKDILAGGKEGSEALVELSEHILNMKDDTAQWDIAKAVFGTKWEDQGEALLHAIIETEGSIIQTDEAVNQLNEDLSTVQSDPAVALSNAFGQVKQALSPVLEVLAQVITKIAEFAQNNPTLTATIVAVAAAGGVMVGAFALLMPAVGALISSIAPLGGIFSALSAAIAAIASPIGLAVIAIGTIGAALVIAYKESETFRDGVNKIFGAVKDFVVESFTAISSFAQEKFSEIRKFWDENGEQIKQAFENVFNAIKKVIETIMPVVQSIVEGTIDAVKNVIDGGLDFIMGLVKTFSSLFTGDFKGMWEGIKQMFSGAVEAIWGIVQLGFVGKILKVIKGFGSDAIKFITDMVSKAKNKFGEIVSSGASKFNELKDKILTPIRSAKDTISKIVDDIKGFFSRLSLKIPDIKMPKLPKFKLDGEFSLNPPSVPKLSVSWNALGGVFNKPTILQSRAGLQGVGEAGPEAIIPLKPEVLAGIGKGIAEQMGSGGPSTIVVQSVLDGRVIAESVTNFVSQNQRNNAAMSAITKGVYL